MIRLALAAALFPLAGVEVLGAAWFACAAAAATRRGLKVLFACLATVVTVAAGVIAAAGAVLV